MIEYRWMHHCSNTVQASTKSSPRLYGANPVDPSIPGVLGCPKPTKCPPAMSRSTKQHHWIPSVSSSPPFTRWYLIRYWPRVGDRLAWPVLSWPLRLSIWTFEGVSIGAEASDLQRYLEFIGSLPWLPDSLGREHLDMICCHMLSHTCQLDLVGCFF